MGCLATVKATAGRLSSFIILSGDSVVNLRSATLWMLFVEVSVRVTPAHFSSLDNQAVVPACNTHTQMYSL